MDHFETLHKIETVAIGSVSWFLYEGNIVLKLATVSWKEILKQGLHFFNFFYQLFGALRQNFELLTQRSLGIS